ncbi:MAG: Crp/Fnr family transcriptional regulator [Gammaproteobacteria bacterium]
MNRHSRPDASDVADDALRAIYLFEHFEADHLQRVRASTQVVKLDQGERLFDVGEPARQVHYLRSGQLKLYRTSPAGDEKVLHLVRPRETFAEAIMFMGRSAGYPVSAEALAKSEVWSFDARTVREVLNGSVDMCFRLLARLSVRLHDMVEEIDRLTLHNATFRLVSFLLNELPEDVVKSPDIQLTTPKLVIASRLSVKPETLSRILHNLAEQGLVSVQGAHIVLRDVDGLRALLES